MGMHLEGVPTTLSLESALDMLSLVKRDASAKAEDEPLLDDARRHDDDDFFDLHELEP
jgi:hypothetical protein